MACFHAITEKNGEENYIQGKILLKIPKSYWLGVAVSHSPNCCYISLDGGDKTVRELKSYGAMCGSIVIDMCALFLIYRIYLHTLLALPEPLCRPNTWSRYADSPGSCWHCGVPAEASGTGCVGGETGVSVGPSKVITGLVEPQPPPKGLKTTGITEEAEVGACSSSRFYIIAWSQGYLNVKFLCSS